MTEKEQKLLEIAKEIVELNKHLGARLAGSLMLALRGLKKRREACDIDITYNYGLKEGGHPVLPQQFAIVEEQGSQTGVIRFLNTDGVKVDFMSVQELSENVQGVPCATVESLITAKWRYYQKAHCEEARKKHCFDLIYLRDKNQELQTYFEDKKLCINSGWFKYVWKIHTRLWNNRGTTLLYLLYGRRDKRV